MVNREDSLLPQLQTRTLFPHDPPHLPFRFHVYNQRSLSNASPRTHIRATLRTFALLSLLVTGCTDRHRYIGGLL